MGNELKLALNAVLRLQFQCIVDEVHLDVLAERIEGHLAGVLLAAHRAGLLHCVGCICFDFLLYYVNSLAGRRSIVSIVLALIVLQLAGQAVVRFQTFVGHLRFFDGFLGTFRTGLECCLHIKQALKVIFFIA